MKYLLFTTTIIFLSGCGNNPVNEYIDAFEEEIILMEYSVDAIDDNEELSYILKSSEAGLKKHEKDEALRELGLGKESTWTAAQRERYSKLRIRSNKAVDKMLE